MSETDRRGGAYAPPPDDYETFDARDAEQDRRGWLFLGAAGVVFVMFVAVVWNTFQLGVREREDSPVIAADAEPYRVPPADPGGYEAPDQDLAVTQLREGGGESGEAPADPPAAPRETTEEPVDMPVRDEGEGGEREDGESLPAVTVETADADALDEPAETAPDRAGSEPASPPQPGAGTPAPDTGLARDPAPDPEPVLPVSPDAPVLPEPTREGAFVAQIAAYRSAEDAETGWLAFASRFPDFAAGRAPDIQRADLGDRGVFHRLRVAAFASRSDAEAYCEALRNEGQACMERAR